MSNVHEPSRYRHVFPGERSSTLVGGPSKARSCSSLLPIRLAEILDLSSSADSVAAGWLDWPPFEDGLAATCADAEWPDRCTLPTEV
jgi:hypothetical protein